MPESLSSEEFVFRCKKVCKLASAKDLNDAKFFYESRSGQLEKVVSRGEGTM
jgi:hypothetical protein